MNDQSIERDIGRPIGSRLVGLIRAAIGLLGGLALYALYEAGKREVWPATDGRWFAPLCLLGVFIPPILLVSVGALRRLALIVWPVAAAVVIGGLGCYAVARGTDPDALGSGMRPLMAPLTVFIAGGLFIAHHLIAAADADRRWVARYPNYFDLAWKHGVQLVLSGAFTAVFWGLLALGSALFRLIGLTFFTELIKEPSFALPATGLIFAFAVHLTDVRPVLIRSARTIALNLLSWLMPLMALIGAGFLVALPFTGLQPLWETRSAVSIVLSSAAVMIILINAAFQDGEASTPPLLRWGGRVAAVLLVPLVAIAAYGLALRVAQHGWTPDRITALACVLVATCYAGGCAFAAVRPGRWLAAMERTNVVAAALILVVLLALFSPVADPARISVNDQIRRLDSGRVKLADFDFEFLRSRSARFGMEALRRLKADKDPAVARRAAEILAGGRPRPPVLARPVDLAASITVYPKGETLPPSFLQQDWRDGSGDPPYACPDNDSARRCEAFQVDLNGDEAKEVIIGSDHSQLSVFALADGRWSRIGRLAPGYCDAALNGLRMGQVTTSTPRWRSLVAGGVTLRLDEDLNCPAAAQ